MPGGDTGAVPGLEHVSTLQIDLAADMHDLGPDGPFGHRFLLDIAGGDVSGEALSGTVARGGGDWMLLGRDGWGRLDVRFAIKTEDGATVTYTGTGLLQFNEAVATALGNGAATDFEDQYYRTAGRLECGDPRYAWVNQSMFVTEGRLSPRETGRGIEARILRIT
jgi:hypothetical protein